MRTFIALPLPDAVTQQLEGFGERLKLGRPQPAENLHVTLAFLGDQPDEALEDIHNELDALRAPPVKLHLAGLEPLGGKVPLVLALRAEGADALQKQVKQAVHRAGYALPHRRFRGHVTLARLPRKPTPDDMSALGHALETHGVISFAPVMLDVMSLYRSDLHPDGARYERLADYPLSG